jgi:hypothetical protein
VDEKAFGPDHAHVVEPVEVTDKATFCPAHAGLGNAEAAAVPGTPLTVTGSDAVTLPQVLLATTDKV